MIIEYLDDIWQILLNYLSPFLPFTISLQLSIKLVNPI